MRISGTYFSDFLPDFLTGGGYNLLSFNGLYFREMAFRYCGMPFCGSPVQFTCGRAMCYSHLQRASRPQVRSFWPHLQADPRPQCILRHIDSAGDFHEAGAVSSRFAAARTWRIVCPLIRTLAPALNSGRGPQAKRSGRVSEAKSD